MPKNSYGCHHEDGDPAPIKFLHCSSQRLTTVTDPLIDWATSAPLISFEKIYIIPFHSIQQHLLSIISVTGTQVNKADRAFLLLELVGRH